MASGDLGAGESPADSGSEARPSGYRCGDVLLPVWPDGQEVKIYCDGVVALTRFADTAHYHQRLVDKVLAMESSDSHARRYFRGAGGIKVYDLPAWGIPEAELLHARALEMFRRALKTPKAQVDVCWANIFRDGDFIMPHSHTRSSESIVYFLSNGAEDRDNPLNGRFSVVDPRLEECCKDQEGRMTTPWVPPQTPGVMIMFPAAILHFVNPHRGEQPRISVAWNISEDKLPGAPIPDGAGPVV